MQKHKKQNLYIEGIVMTTPRGLGFLRHPDYEEDIRLEVGSLNTALNGDTVKVSIYPTSKGRQPTGKVVSVIKRGKERFVGVIDTRNNKTYVIPDDRKMYTDIFIPHPPQEAKAGTKALVKTDLWTNPDKNLSGEIVELLGMKGVHDVEMRSITLEHNIDTDFDDVVEKEAQHIKQTLGVINTKDIAERRDFRKIATLTIDPANAKDFDDALSVRAVKNNLIEVGIHIADVSHYVRPQTALDKEARKRGFSTYLVDRVIPMLPEILSNDLASLNPDEDKLAFSAVFVLDKTARVKKRWFGRTVIRSSRRLTYEEAQNILESDSGTYAKELQILNTLAKKLRQKKTIGGAIDFAQDEIGFELDSEGVPIKIARKKRLDTHKLIEEFMLLANREVATFIYKTYNKKNKRHAFIYRVHDVPNPEKLADLSLFLKALGYSLRTKSDGTISGKALNTLFEKIEGSPEEGLIKIATLRSMAKAAYATKNIGHFGLGFGFYTHFTSPIRRYADLIVHRLLSQCVAHESLPNTMYSHYERVARELSEKEIRIAEAERDSVKYKQVEYMSGNVGRAFDGVISGVSEWGVFVAELETGAEGLVRIRDMTDDFYKLEQKKYRLVGKKKKKSYSLGDRVKIEVVGANIDKKTLDYKFV